MDIVVDFDGTCVKHEYPKVGDDIGAAPVLKRLVEAGHRLIIFTMRSEYGVEEGMFESGLNAVVEWYKDNGIPLYGVQTNPTQKQWTESPKAYGQMYIDDAALGCPLIYPDENSPVGERAYVDWNKVEEMLEARGIL